MSLLIKTIGDEIPSLHKNNVRLKCIGDLKMLPKNARNEMLEGIEKTKNNTGLVLSLALSYSGKWDIVQAIKQIAAKVQSNELGIEDINENMFNKFLSTYPDPDVDFLIRTGGDHRISNYLLWQSAYAELLFLDDVFWPDFRKEHLKNAIKTYQQRERRFGKTGDQIKTNK
jgi:undecaprenyl diphosphate synthase